MNRIRTLTAAGVAVGVAGSFLLAAPAAAAPNGDLIVFVRGGDLWTMPASGGEPTQLTRTDDREDTPSWSSDGTRVRFVRSSGWGVDGTVWEKDLRADLDDPGTQISPDGLLVDDVDWSPDGQHVTFTRDLPTNPKGNQTQQDVFVASSTFTDMRNVSSHPAHDSNPDFSSTGRIAFDSTREGSSSAVYTVPALEPDAAPTRVPTSNPKDGGKFPAWSPTGDRLVYMEYLSGSAKWGLQMYDGTTETVLTASDANEWHAEFSPAGDHVVVGRGALVARKTWHLVTIRLSDGMETALTSEDGPAATQPSWRPGVAPTTTASPGCVLPPVCVAP